MPNPTFSGVFYQIFIPSFCDANGDGIGDLRGIEQRLDYLQALGIEGIWLSPLHPSESYHKYDVLDYYSVAEQYGTMDDLRQLLDACHTRGMRVLLDLVLNCSSWHHPAFQRALCDPSCEERSWYWFDDTPEAAVLDRSAQWNDLPSWHTAPNGAHYLGLYGSVMPDYNFYNPGIRRVCKQIAKFWLDMGFDGFRLDSAMHLFSSSETAPGVSYHALNVEWWAEFRDYCRSIRPDCLLVGEVWTDSNMRALYYRGLDCTFHFDLGIAIGQLLHGDLSSEVFTQQLESAQRSARLVTPDFIDAPFLSNHDMPRFAEFSNCTAAELKLAAAIYLTLPGIPFVYYGEELGLRPFPDDFCPDFSHDDQMARSRTAFAWPDGGVCRYRFSRGYDATPMAQQEQDSTSLLQFYRRMIHLRRICMPLRYGDWRAYTACHGTLRYTRQWGDASATLIHNISDTPVLIPRESADAVDLMSNASLEMTAEHDRWILLPKHSMIFYTGSYASSPAGCAGS